jgi:hypothetical protein
MGVRTYIIGLLFLVNLFGCNKDKSAPLQTASPDVDLHIDFHHFVNDLPVSIGSMEYVNANTDTFSIKTIKYFISRLTLHRTNADSVLINHHFYIDQSLNETLSKVIPNVLFEGEYNAISFTVGFHTEDNISNMFTSNPEYQMYWPSNMGGGYHYQKLEGQFLNQGISQNFNFHAGGLDQVDYSIRVKLDQPTFQVTSKELNLNLNMEIQNWFTSPVIWDFAYFGSAIMQNHEAQATIQKNGHDVFSVIVN